MVCGVDADASPDAQAKGDGLGQQAAGNSAGASSVSEAVVLSGTAVDAVDIAVSDVERSNEERPVVPLVTTHVWNKANTVPTVLAVQQQVFDGVPLPSVLLPSLQIESRAYYLRGPQLALAMLKSERGRSRADRGQKQPQGEGRGRCVEWHCC